MTVTPIQQPASPVHSLRHEPFTPFWWANRLHTKLRSRQDYITRHRKYASGEADDPTIDAKASRAFRRILGLSKTNLCGLIVEATAERMAVQGFRFGNEPDDDKDAWRIWQASDFDAQSELLITDSLEAGRSFILVEPSQDGGLPRLYAEDASQMIVAYAPGDRRRRLAGWKEWLDEWTGETHGTLYLPDHVVKLRSPSKPGYTSTVQVVDHVQPVMWQFRDERVEAEPNPLREVPVWEITNRPTLNPDVARSEVEDVLGDQDACNHIALNALIACEYGAFRQKWMTGLEVPRDPVTGEPVEPFDVAVNRMLISENDAARFGDFNATDLEPYIKLYESRVRHMAAVTRTPVAMLLGGMVNLAAEALALSVAGLVQKVTRKTKYVEQPFEAALRACFRLQGDPRADADNAETVWVDPEIRSSAQQADAAVKLTAGKVIAPQTAQELYLGMSDVQRDRDMEWRTQNETLPGMASLLGPDPAEQEFGGFTPTE